ncbi:DUF1559 domain-containing protein [Isosphaeraceae bacterium EP7]
MGPPLDRAPDGPSGQRGIGLWAGFSLSIPLYLFGNHRLFPSHPSQFRRLTAGELGRTRMIHFKLSVRKLMLVVAVAAIGFAMIELFRRGVESARSLSCTNQMKELTFAVISYTEWYNRGNGGEFPRGQILANMPPEMGTSWIHQASGYLDVSAVYTTTDPSKPFDVVPNLTYSRLSIGSLTCPKCPMTTTAGGFATTSYVGIAGVGADAPILAAGHPRAGIFGYTRVTRMADLKDGAARTMMLAETGLNNGCWMSGGSSTIRSADPAQRPYIGAGRPFGGFHEGGANVAFADGSVRFIRGTIDPAVFEALTTIAGGDVVGDDFE